MTGTPQSNPLITSEHVLEQLFRAGYDRWIAEARSRLGDEAAAAAPRVVSKVFHQAWTDRQRFVAPEELDAFIGANIQHQAARELSRRASAKRLEARAGAQKEAHDHSQMTVDEAWERLQHTLQGGAPEASRKRASAARHEAAEHMASLGKSRAVWKTALGVAVALGGIAFAIWYLERAAEFRAHVRALNAPDVRNYSTSYGQQANVRLDDSTVVLLGPESKLTVPAKFGADLRAVKLVGAANFNVTLSMDSPLEVLAGDVLVLAPGTVFTVRRYNDDSAVVVHARQGEVDVRLAKEVRRLEEGRSLLVTNSGTMRIPSTEELDEASAWVDGTVSIVGRTLRQALPQLRRWYGLDIRVQDTTILDRPVFVRAAITSERDAISSVEKSGGVRFTYIGAYMAFKDAGPARPSGRQ